MPAHDCDRVATPSTAPECLPSPPSSAGKAPSILGLLDEECALPKGSDEAYVTKLHTYFEEGFECYSKPKARYRGRTGSGPDEPQFTVHHYADSVTYTATGWLEKNKGGLALNLEQLMRASAIPLLQALYAEADEGMLATARADERRSSDERPRLTGTEAPLATAKKKTVMAHFRDSLRQLFVSLDVTAARYVRCLKPNGAKQANRYDGRYVERQLAYNGVLALVEIQAAGYAVSLPKREFVARYTCCCVPDAALSAALGAVGTEPEAACSALLDAAQATLAKRSSVGAAPGGPPKSWLSEGAAVFGHSKIFLKEGVLRELERARDVAARAAAIHVQAAVRRRIARGTLRLLRTLRQLAASIRKGLKDALKNETNLERVMSARRQLQTLVNTVGDPSEAEGVDAESERGLVLAVPCVLRVVASEMMSLEELVSSHEKLVEAQIRQEKERVEAVKRAAEVEAAKEAERARQEAEKAAADRAAKETADREAKAKAAEKAAWEAEKAAEKAAEEEREKERETAAKEAAVRQVEAAKRQAEAEAKQADKAKVEAAAKASLKRAEPCDKYVLDTSAATFGDCTCGHAKSAHSAAALAAGQAEGGGKKAGAFMPKVEEKVSLACGDYRVDMTATRFGDCVCGFPKNEHTVAAANARGVELNDHDKPADLRNCPPAARNGGRAARLAAQRALVNEKMSAVNGACDDYRVDVTAARFGDCANCAQPKSSHSILATRRGEAPSSVEKKKKFTVKGAIGLK